MPQVAVRLPQQLVDEVDSLAAGMSLSRSDLIRRALELHVYRLACERDAAVYQRQPLTDAELALTDDPEGWSTAAPW